MKGTYVLVTELKKDSKMKIGNLGEIIFPRGYYCYVGSALGKSTNLENRIGRHKKLNEEKKGKLHWHIDYLLRVEGVSIESIFVQESETKNECAIAAAVSERGVPVKGFGCSDCRCYSHLFRVKGCESLIGLGLNRRPPSEYLA